MKILLDMNIPKKYEYLLSKKGYEVIKWDDIGACNATDIDIMNYARENGYVILTYDLDFGAVLSASNETHPSVIQIRSTIYNAEHITDFITAAINQCSNELMQGALLSIDTKKSGHVRYPV